jgi:hypothetical protein
MGWFWLRVACPPFKICFDFVFYGVAVQRRLELDGPARFAAPACMKLSHGVVHCYLKAADIAPVFSSSDCKHFATALACAGLNVGRPVVVGFELRSHNLISCYLLGPWGIGVPSR